MKEIQDKLREEVKNPLMVVDLASNPVLVGGAAAKGGQYLPREGRRTEGGQEESWFDTMKQALVDGFKDTEPIKLNASEMIPVYDSCQVSKEVTSDGITARFIRAAGPNIYFQRKTNLMTRLPDHDFNLLKRKKMIEESTNFLTKSCVANITSGHKPIGISDKGWTELKQMVQGTDAHYDGDADFMDDAGNIIDRKKQNFVEKVKASYRSVIEEAIELKNSDPDPNRPLVIALSEKSIGIYAGLKDSKRCEVAKRIVNSCIDDVLKESKPGGDGKPFLDYFHTIIRHK